MADEVPDRRAEDNPTPTRKVVDRGLAVLTLVFLIAFLWRMIEVLHVHTCWCDFATPPGVSEVLTALLCGLAAIASSIGLDVSSLIKGFKK